MQVRRQADRETGTLAVKGEGVTNQSEHAANQVQSDL